MRTLQHPRFVTHRHGHRLHLAVAVDSDDDWGKAPYLVHRLACGYSEPTQVAVSETIRTTPLCEGCQRWIEGKIEELSGLLVKGLTIESIEITTAS